MTAGSVNRLRPIIDAPISSTTMWQALRMIGAAAGGPNRPWTWRMPLRNAPLQINSTYGSMMAVSLSISTRSGANVRSK